MAEEEKKTASSKLTNFMEKHRKGVFAVFAVIIVALVAYIVIDTCCKSAAEKNLVAIDEISYAMTNESTSLEDDELDARLATALEALVPYTKKGGIAGVRANMLSAEIAYLQEDYEAAVSFWDVTATKGKKSYTAPLANYNKGVCYEELNKLDEAAEAYKLAADNSNFAMANHAKFSYGRVLEEKGDYSGAMSAYSELYEKDLDDTWANIAKSRMINLQIEGKAE